ncbi:hypothetical protein [Guyparkeria halopsychrophila]|uniref:hypothetical protein n=1 Tax=Guyparkeria halopsychrophila TaxID=3139421 RepID=UPI0037C8410C
MPTKTSTVFAVDALEWALLAGGYYLAPGPLQGLADWVFVLLGVIGFLLSGIVLVADGARFTFNDRPAGGVAMGWRLLVLGRTSSALRVLAIALAGAHNVAIIYGAGVLLETLGALKLRREYARREAGHA